MSWAKITKYLLTRLAFASVVPAIPQVPPRHSPVPAPPADRHSFEAPRQMPSTFMARGGGAGALP